MGETRPKCPKLGQCRLFTVLTLNSTLQIWKDNYCNGDFGRCSRYKNEACGAPVPDLLLPNGHILGKR